MPLIKKAYLLILSGFIIAAFGSCGGSENSTEYVAIGASDATGIGATPPSNGYVFRIQREISTMCRNTELFNLGIPAADADVITETELRVATEIGPDFATVWVGSNDLVGGRSASEFRADLDEILGSLVEETDGLTFVGNIPDLTMLPKFQDEPDSDVTAARVAAFNSAIADVVSARGAIPIELSAISLNEVLVSEDGFHPSDEGHAAIANRFLDEMLPRVCAI